MSLYSAKGSNANRFFCLSHRPYKVALDLMFQGTCCSHKINLILRYLISKIGINQNATERITTTHAIHDMDLALFAEAIVYSSIKRKEFSHPLRKIVDAIHCSRPESLLHLPIQRLARFNMFKIRQIRANNTHNILFRAPLRLKRLIQRLDICHSQFSQIVERT